jgi:glucosyl-3-phosphoglycerate synthase
MYISKMTVKTFHHKNFLPVAALIAKKKQRGDTVSLIIPALNEEKTIGDIIACCRKELMERAPLVDEILVMDGGSGDRTRDRAAAAGAVVYNVKDVRPDLSTEEGKGAGLWKSQFVARGTILAYIDADIVNFDPRFVYGIVGALLGDPDIYCVKSLYRRPLVVDKKVLPDHGGRVTEILVRPLLSLWMPELAQVCQPLSGEYAFRKEILNRLPFWSGYGVELGLLLDMYRMFGLTHIAQVDMEERVHRNRPVAELGKMSFAVLKTFFAYLQREKIVTLSSVTGDRMISLTKNGPLETRIIERLLPPAIECIRRAP